MRRLLTWSAPLATIAACLAAVVVIDLGDLWLGALVAAAAIVILILPTLPDASEDASTVHAPSDGPQPAAGAIEAAPAANRRLRDNA